MKKSKNFYRRGRKERKGNAKDSAYLFFFALVAFFAVAVLAVIMLSGKI